MTKYKNIPLENGEVLVCRCEVGSATGDPLTATEKNMVYLQNKIEEQDKIIEGSVERKEAITKTVNEVKETHKNIVKISKGIDEKVKRAERLVGYILTKS